MTELNEVVVAEFRANAGVVIDAMGGHFKDIHLLLLHHTGRRSGREYVTPLLYVEDGDNYVLVGSNGVYQLAPACAANVASMAGEVIEVRGRSIIRSEPTSCAKARNGIACMQRRWPIGPISSNTRPTPTALFR